MVTPSPVIRMLHGGCFARSSVLTQGNLVPNASILVLGSTTPTVTDSSGAFSLTGVKAPYDVAVLANGSRVATVYKGLSRQTITLTLLGTLALTPRTGTLEGNLSGGDTATGNHIVLFASPEVRAEPSVVNLNNIQRIRRRM